MHASAWSIARLARPSIVIALVLAALAGGVAQPRVRAADPSTQPAASASPVVPAAPEAMCQSASDLRLYVGFLRSQSIGEDALVPILVGIAASLSEARNLAGHVGETYRPLVDDLVVSLQDLQSAVRGFRDQGTVGSGLVQLGESITALGNAMDALSGAFSAPCPVAAPGASAMPAASASPAA